MMNGNVLQHLDLHRTGVIGGGLHFECRGCGRCCSGEGYVFITREEGEAMAGILGVEHQAFLAGHTRFVEGRTALRDAPNCDCIFLGERKCRVYAARPYQCRSWPFWFANLRSAEAWENACRSCPGIGTGRLYSSNEIVAWVNGSPFLKGKK